MVLDHHGEYESHWAAISIAAKVGSDIDSLADAQKLLAHSNASATKQHYWRKEAKVVSGKGFKVEPK
jgi:hypothetical protein